MADRLHCMVPGCRHTSKHHFIETSIGKLPVTSWVCKEHWAAIPKTYRAVYRRVLRDFSRNKDPLDQAGRVDRIWKAMVRKAIEISAGIQ